MADIAFIGLGVMGLNMAKNVIAGGFNVAGYDISAAAMQAHSDNGGIASGSAAEAADGAGIIVTMLHNGGIVRSALFDKGGAVETAPSGALVIDMSTIHPLQTDAIRADLAEKGLSMVDAPVGRTSIYAKTGNSQFMVGARVNPRLKHSRVNPRLKHSRVNFFIHEKLTPACRQPVIARSVSINIKHQKAQHPQ